jgi:hypothetical protein
MSGKRAWFALSVACAVAGLAATVWVGPPAGATVAVRTWFVSAAAPLGGDGSSQRPFDTLNAVEQFSSPGDTIMVLPSPARVAPLDGGIALKVGQKLLGAGAPVAGIGANAAAPRITNSSAAHHFGDAVVLASGAEVANIAVAHSYRGAIYGADVTNVTVRNNDLSATNTSCATGFVVQPFTLPTLVRGVGVPFSTGLSNGWAAIMIDTNRARASMSIAGNTIHDTNCADGIDIRAARTADVTAQITGNHITRLHEDLTKESVLAIGLQSTDTAHLTANVDNNTEIYIGSAIVGDLGIADSEGLFENAAGRSQLSEHVDHNVFAHGLGHLSANCVEEVASNGTPVIAMTLTNSSCDYVVGDVLEAANLAHATMSLNIDHVRASHSTWPLAAAQATVLPGDDGDCLMEAVSGSASTTSVSITNSQFTHCAADGLGVVSNVVDGSNAPIKKISFDVQNSQISDNGLSNLRVESATGIQQLDGKIENTDLSTSAGTPVILANLAGPQYKASTTVDLGGGRLGSTGHNCIDGGLLLDVLDANYDLAAEHDWWGQPSGPAFGRTLAVAATITSAPALTQNTCGPTSPPGPQPNP